MSRRNFLGGIFSSRSTSSAGQMGARSTAKAAPILSGLTPITGDLGVAKATHLLRRTQFGATPAEINDFATKDIEEALDIVLAIPNAAPPPPVDPNNGQTWIGQPRSGSDGTFFRYMQAWWIERMFGASGSIIEKMTLFWHQFLANDRDVVNESRHHYKQNALFRQYALGNCKDLIREITIDPCMLRYLNGNASTRTRPNENYARELQELFTIGKGPEIAPGNYTNYTEHDVQMAARVLTGWQVNNTTVESFFTLSRHDIGDKTFSSAYNNTVIQGRNSQQGGLEELNDLLDMIFNRPATSEYFVRKLHYWFVSFEITETIETNIIQPLALLLRQQNYNMLPVIRTLLSSEYFFDAGNRGAFIKNPIEFVLTFIKDAGVQVPTAPVTRYTFFDSMRQTARRLGMEVFNPPGVAGWEAYHQEPNFHKQWINSVTLPLRNEFTDRFVNASTIDGYNYNFDIIAFVEQRCATPTLPSAVVQSFVRTFIPVELTQGQLQHLTENIFLQQQAASIWESHWNAYQATPTNTTHLNNVRNRLRNFLRVLLRMAEIIIV